MKRLRSLNVLIIAILTLLFVEGVVASFAVAKTGQFSGYVQYKVTVNSPENPSLTMSAIVNESSRPTGQTGFVDITLLFTSAKTNFTYSRDVNSTSLPEIFPYLSGLTNQSFSYAVQGFSIKANLVNTGQVPISFNSASYQATKYLISFYATNSSSMKSISADGNIISMPSGLIDTIQLLMNKTTSVNVSLLSTNLSLNGPASSINPVGASMLGTGVFAAVVIAAPTIFKKAKHDKLNNQTQTNETKTARESDVEQEKEGKTKPSYWVD